MGENRTILTREHPSRAKSRLLHKYRLGGQPPIHSPKNSTYEL